MKGTPAAPSAPMSHEFSSTAARLMVVLALAIAAACGTWQAWDMFGTKHRSMLQGWDDSFYYVWLPSVVIDHDVDFLNQLAHSNTISAASLRDWLAHPRTATGLLPNKYPPGWAFGSLPFFLAAYAVAPAGTTGFEPLYLLTVWFGQLLYAAVGIVFAIKIIRRLLPDAPAAIAVLAVWLASPLVYYQTARVFQSHSQVFAVAMAVFWLGIRIADGENRGRVWFALGFSSALLVATRNVTVVYLVFAAAILIQHLRSWRAAVWILSGAAGPAVTQLLAQKALFGSWFVYTYGDERFDFSHLHLAHALFSPRHGWFYWHPLLLVGILAFLGWTLRRPMGWPWVASLGTIIVLNSAWPTWWFGSSFGNRAFEVATFFAMIGIAALLSAVRDRPAWSRTLAGVIALAVSWNLVLLALFLTERISHEQAATYFDAGRACANWFASLR